MSNPRFSVVIPTRNRHNTLKFAILTCLNQKNFDDYEIIVCDNCSSPETKKTVESFESKKIKYIRSDRPLAMSQNWELAVSHAKGEYIIVIGDDDGLLLSALRKIDSLLKILNVKVLRWEYVIYNWPNSPVDPNRLNIPLLVNENRILQCQDVISRVANYKMDWRILPEMYNSAIHRDLINLLREKTGRVFAASCPDVYSGFAFAYLSHSYASIGLPMSIGGTSASSNGFAVNNSKDSPIAQEFNLLNTEACLGCHHKIPDVPVMPAFIADSFQRAKDALFPDDKIICIDRKNLIINCVRSINSRFHKNLEDEEMLQTYMCKTRESLKDDIKLQKWFDRKFRDYSKDKKYMPGWYCLLREVDDKLFGCNSKDINCYQGFEKGFDGGNIVLDAKGLGLNDVFSVAEFCDHFYSPDIANLEWHGQGIAPELLILLKKLRPNIARILLRNI